MSTNNSSSSSQNTDFVTVLSKKELHDKREVKKQEQANDRRAQLKAARVAHNKNKSDNTSSVSSASASTSAAPNSATNSSSTESADVKVKLTPAERAAKKAEYEARKLRREQKEKDNVEYKNAMKEAENLCLQELLLPKKVAEDKVIEARYTINDRTGAPNRNFSIRVDHVRSLTNTNTKDKNTKDNTKDNTNDNTNDNNTNDNNTNDNDTNDNDSYDTICVGKYKFSRTKFYSNRFFNNALSNMYDTTMQFKAYLRANTFRNKQTWTLYITW